MVLWEHLAYGGVIFKGVSDARAVPRLVLVSQLRAFSRWQWLAVAATTAVTAILTGLPTDIVPNSFYARMTPILWWNYPVWAATAVLTGLVFATYVRVQPGGRSVGVTAGGGLLSFFAVGCPICNKLVVALIGVGGALSFFRPVQPYMALAGLALIAASLTVRLRGLESCEVKSATPEPSFMIRRSRSQ